MNDFRQNFLAVVTFVVRPSLFLVFGLAGGYYMGYSDAFRETDTLGDKVSRIVYKVHPEGMSQGIRQRASVIRDTVEARAGVDIPPN
jgi:hypothetical protein